MSEGVRIQVVLDLDNTMIHAAGRTGAEVDLFRRLHCEVGRSLYDVWRARKSGKERTEVYQMTHEFTFKEGAETTLALLQVRPALFEAMIELRKSDCDVHIYSKGKNCYVHAVLRVLFGRMDSPNCLINGNIITKGEDTSSRKDLRNLLSAEQIEHAVVLDDQPGVWTQLGTVLATPPFFAFSNMAKVHPYDRVIENKERYLMVACQQISLMATHITKTGDSSVDALAWLRTTLLRRMRHQDGRSLSLLIVAPQGADYEFRAELEHLCGTVLSHGGHVADVPSTNVTHVVSDSATANRWADQCGKEPHLVGVQWLVDTLLYAHKMNEGEYHPEIMSSRQQGVRDLLASRSRDFLRQLAKHHLPNLTRYAGEIVTSSAVAAVAASLLTALPSSSDTASFADHLFSTKPFAPFVVDKVPHLSPLSTMLYAGDIIRGCNRSDDLCSTEAVEKQLDIFEGKGSVLTLVVETKHLGLRQLGAMTHGWDIGITEVVVTRLPQRHLTSGCITAALVCAVTVLAMPYCSATVASSRGLVLSPGLVVVKATGETTHCVGKQVVALNGRIVKCLVDYYLVKKKTSGPMRLLLSGSPSFASTLIPPPRPKARKRKRHEEHPSNS